MSISFGAVYNLQSLEDAIEEPDDAIWVSDRTGNVFTDYARAREDDLAASGVLLAPSGTKLQHQVTVNVGGDEDSDDVAVALQKVKSIRQKFAAAHPAVAAQLAPYVTPASLVNDVQLLNSIGVNDTITNQMIEALRQLQELFVTLNGVVNGPGSTGPALKPLPASTRPLSPRQEAAASPAASPASPAAASPAASPASPAAASPALQFDPTTPVPAAPVSEGTGGAGPSGVPLARILNAGEPGRRLNLDA